MRKLRMHELNRLTPQEFKDIDKVQIVFYDTDERFKKLEFIITDHV